MPYCQDSSLIWFYNNVTKRNPGVLILMADNMVMDDGPVLLYGAEDDQINAIEVNAELKATITADGYVFEAKIPIEEIGLTEADLALGHIHATAMTVNIFNTDFSGYSDELWENAGYQATYAGVNQWNKSPKVSLTGKEYDYEESEEDDWWASPDTSDDDVTTKSDEPQTSTTEQDTAVTPPTSNNMILVIIGVIVCVVLIAVVIVIAMRKRQV